MCVWLNFGGVGVCCVSGGRGRGEGVGSAE